MLTVNINPVKILNKTASKLSAYVMHYDLDAQNCTTFWILSDDNDVRLYEGNYDIPPEILKEWASDDDVIITAIAKGLGFEINKNKEQQQKQQEQEQQQEQQE